MDARSPRSLSFSLSLSPYQLGDSDIIVLRWAFLDNRDVMFVLLSGEQQLPHIFVISSIS